MATLTTDQWLKHYQENPADLRAFIEIANEEANKMAARIDELEAGLFEVIRQADSLPTHKKPRGDRQWLANNQRTWVIRHAKDALGL